MKIQRAFSILIILFASFQICLGQENSEAILVDEIGLAGCEELIAKQDNFFVEITNSPNSIGYAVIYGKKKEVFRTERILRGQLEARKFDEKRFVIIRGKEEKELHIEFWKVPAGAEKPEFEEAKWDLSLSKNKKPFIFNASKWDDGPCPIGNQLKTYSEYLIKNPNARGNVVIFAKSKAEFQKQKEKLLDEIIKKYKVSNQKIRFFFVKRNLDYESFEFWLLP